MAVRCVGRTKRYNHSITVNYTAPLKNIPLLDWMNVRATYQGTYGWEAASLTPLAQARGNLIQNTQSRKVEGDLDFNKLYNKSKYLKKINSKPRPRRGNRGNQSRNSRSNSNKKGDDKNRGFSGMYSIVRRISIS